ncbi:hydroxyacylglutathione hydrolase [Alicycliphilus denitrificans]|jgi:hypothetical protein|uniref:Hydroxyacylglutathione hydrolase n=1 Tax=Alicycliphilus denitrificans TaxID=179636 RepID=A0A3R7HU01_9BURK|nr:hydroxyacylglutathione hydrolase [Alicycliphilus denitrificans]RKJ95075.1 hydroxyacylglutathione hydrolase [Alicycliphilus denitrificans]HRP21702.1 hydroxyacylglutathione hydrolase [Alicycliphilus sp.]
MRHLHHLSRTLAGTAVPGALAAVASRARAVVFFGPSTSAGSVAVSPTVNGTKVPGPCFAIPDAGPFGLM